MWTPWLIRYPVSIRTMQIGIQGTLFGAYTPENDRFLRFEEGSREPQSLKICGIEII